MINLFVKHQCPQCGAPALLLETDRLFECGYCKVKSYLITKDHFRYRLPSSAPKNKKLVFFPYWRFKGMLFCATADNIKHKFIDVSHQAIESQYFPISVGLRSQALKIQFVSSETEGRFLKPTQSLEQVIQSFEGRFIKTLPKPILHQSHIGETISLLYSPVYVENRVYDAVINRPVSALLPDGFDIEQFSGGQPDWCIQFLSTLCPHCGWDLQGARDTWVLLCKNCNSTWYPAGQSMKQLKFGKYPCIENAGIYLPFWRIRADIKGVHLKSYTDLIKVANLPKVSQPGWENIEFRFWVPAFKILPKVFLRLSTHFTLAQPYQKLITELPENRHYPINLPVAEAVEILKINLASFLKPTKLLIDLLRDIKIDVKSFVLVYMPFEEKHHEFIQPDVQMAINKNILVLSNNL